MYNIYIYIYKSNKTLYINDHTLYMHEITYISTIYISIDKYLRCIFKEYCN
jgi:hypothetical protein